MRLGILGDDEMGRVGILGVSLDPRQVLVDFAHNRLTAFLDCIK